MGAITRKYLDAAECIVTESYVYAPTDLASGETVRRVKVQRSLWDTGASVSLISAVRVFTMMGLPSWRYKKGGGRTRVLPPPCLSCSASLRTRRSFHLLYLLSILQNL